MTNPEIDLSLVDPMISALNVESTGIEIPDQVYEIGAQIGGIIMSLQEIGIKPTEFPRLYGITPLREDGSQRVILHSDKYPGPGVIRPYTTASVTRHENGLVTYSRYTETSHSVRGERSSESIDATKGLVARVTNETGYTSRPTPETRRFDWSNKSDRPFIGDGLTQLSQSLVSWEASVIKGDLPRQFRRNILPLDRK